MALSERVGGVTSTRLNQSKQRTNSKDLSGERNKSTSSFFSLFFTIVVKDISCLTESGMQCVVESLNDSIKTRKRRSGTWRTDNSIVSRRKRSTKRSGKKFYRERIFAACLMLLFSLISHFPVRLSVKPDFFFFSPLPPSPSGS